MWTVTGTMLDFHHARSADRSAGIICRVADEPLYAPNAKPLPPRVARPGEPPFAFLRGHDRFACELRYHGEWGVEAQFLKNEELLIGRRFDTRERAVRWAGEERQALEKGWEDA
jgi:hypothetical protein